ncbi:molybdenum-dependent oxidoreductase-like protein [Actinocorallia herbida]|uniref:Molybdenum-dependent oxidoreductase-like protein n=1 Tax=Actinocorallia herbida TaxID=58109 RepID=A0A3N1CRI3_9ACTN|nr:sulfite oxidase [Actinocorallia herbida]ROO83923.1 molybdenum-dependent oxidoreductase-like protein [Actinocorallia herbida]
MLREELRKGDGDREMNWEEMRGVGHHTPTDRFFVHHHTDAPVIDVSTWTLTLHGDGLKDGPVTFDHHDLKAMPSVTMSAFLECAGNGRTFYTSQQNQRVSGTPWGLGAIGVAEWTGVPLRHVLEHAGLRDDAVDLMPRGLDSSYVEDGVDHGRFRRPLPVTKAMKDVLVVWEMNGAPLTREHGFPIRLIVPDWVGVASIKWLGDIEVSTSALHSPWSTDFYRLFGLGYPDEGSAPLTTMPVKSAFEIAPYAKLTRDEEVLLTGRSWSGNGPIRSVEVSTDGGRSWAPARMVGPRLAHTWAQWELPWCPDRRGPAVLMARATDELGVTEALGSPYNAKGYLWSGVVRHEITVV